MAGTMFLSTQERMVYAIANEEQWDGEVEAPCGSFTHVSLSTIEQLLIATALEVETDEVPRYWVIIEDNEGFLMFNDFDNFVNQGYFLQEREAEYNAWCNDDDNEAYPFLCYTCGEGHEGAGNPEFCASCIGADLSNG